MSDPGIAIVGLACELPDASSPERLWENVLARRRAFRRLPPERLRLEDHWSADRSAEDRLYATEAGLIEGYEFDRVRFRVPGAAFRAADLTHWLALDVACRALAGAGLSGAARETTGVVLGNTLTGEMSRAAALRLRWPYVRRVLEAALDEPAPELVARVEAAYKEPFEPVGDETLAGALSNTIAGRICNHLDLGGGGYTVDGACAASLLAVVTACERLLLGELDVALAGGVDVSLDPFELVGFAKTGALAGDEMRVYDARPEGFWPGEGCGFVVLMRLADAVAAGARVHAVIRGWGVSSDGSGGLTRPEAAGQLRALRRAYRRAGLDPRAVGLFEGHGTGTAVGDAAELRALTTLRAGAPPAAIGSVKANLGHTKAAAGVAGLIKATLAVREGVIPPTTGCEDPHPDLLAGGAPLRVVDSGEAWPAAERVAGVSAMGFGGINTHAVLSACAVAQPRRELGGRERLLLSSAQDAELFLFAAGDASQLTAGVERLRTRAAGLSRAELGDAARALAEAAGGLRPCGHDPAPEPGAAATGLRASVVASRPAELCDRLGALLALLRASEVRACGSPPGVFLGAAGRPPRIGLLLPGQGSPARPGGGALGRRFPVVEDLVAGGRAGGDPVDTAAAQPAIVGASLAALRVLARLGIEAEVAVGHSLGELTALVWAGVLDEAAGLRIAAARGRAMSALPAGAMAGVALDRERAEALAAGLPLAVAGLNAPAQTVLSGPAEAVEELLARARANGAAATRLPVSHAFHSPSMAPAGEELAALLAREPLDPPRRRVVSTVTGTALTPADDLRALLCRQLTAPVRFAEAAVTAAAELDLLIEAGPGRVLAGLAGSFLAPPPIALDAGGPSLAGLLSAAGAAWALGAPLRPAPLFAERFTRPIDLDRPPRLFANPCERAPWPGPAAATPAAHAPTVPEPAGPPPRDRLALVRELVAARAELPGEAVTGDSRLLDDLHLNSIVVSEIAVEAARALGLPPPLAPAALANASVAMLAEALADGGASALAGTGADLDPPGAGPWTRAFTLELVERPRPPAAPAPPADGRWRVIAPPGHPATADLERALARGPGTGVALCLPPEPGERHLPLFLDAVRALVDQPRLLVLQSGGGGGGFARALHLESPDVATCVVDAPLDGRAAGRAAAEMAGHAEGFTEVRYDRDGVRREPVLRHLPLPAPAPPVLTQADVVLVTGGAKGIAAECVLALARGTGAGVAFLGRSAPAADPALAANLERIAAAGARVRYVGADVTDCAAVATAVAEVESTLGPITGLLHAAGRNDPALARDLDAPLLQATVAPKVAGLRHLLAALARAPLRLLITFGSVIARIGMRGEAHYALANEWQTLATERFAATRPDCACLAFESSVWAAVGMGERLGSVEALARLGVDPIPPDAGADLLARLVGAPERPVAVVAAGRLGRPPALRPERPELPLRRFLERPRVHHPGIELVADAELSPDLDPYLDDHVLDGDRLLPAVIGLEAMAQVATALTGTAAPLRFEDVRLDRPLVVPAGERTTIRVAALAGDDGDGRVVVRSERTGFQVDHFSARWRLADASVEFVRAGRTKSTLGRKGARSRSGPPPSMPRFVSRPADAAVALDPDELYGSLLFQDGRFRRVRRYLRLSATECHAEVEHTEPAGWFGAYLPQELVLGDPGARDAALHALQACVPHARVVPVGVRALHLGPAPAAGPLHVHARERAREPGGFTFDIAVRDAAGTLVERWDGVRLRAVAPITPAGPWPEVLLGVYLERRLEGVDGTLRVAVRAGHGSDAAIHAALGEPGTVRRRPDGRPEAGQARAVSAAHANGVTLAVAATGPVACDIEPAVTRPSGAWRDLLGGARFALGETIAADRGEDVTTAATRIWTAAECLHKAGLPAAPLALVAAADDGWLLLSCGERAIATGVTRVRGIEAPVVVAVLAGGRDARL